jgi:hypothetical protein
MAHHGKNEDIYLNKGGDNEVSALNAKDAVDKKHTQNTDIKLDKDGDNESSASEILKNIYNTILLGFKVTKELSLTIYNIFNGIIDGYSNNTGIDNINSINHQYNASGKYYSPVGGFDSYTKFLCSFDGTNGQKSAEDKSDGAHIISFVGDAELSTAESKFGATSLFVGTPPSWNCVTVPNHDDFKYTTESFTFDGWFRFLSSPNDNMMFLSCAGGGGGFQWYMSYTSMQFYAVGVGVVFATEGFSPTLNQWYHIALVRSGTSVRFFINGIQLGDTLTIANTIIVGTGSLFIGHDGNLSGRVFPGYIDEFRISKGVARWTSNFTPPTSAYNKAVENMILFSNIFNADKVPLKTRIIIIEEDVDSIILNTDLKILITRDGINWEETILLDVLNYDITKRILIGQVDLFEQNSDTDIQYKVITNNNKDLRLHAISLIWD